MGGVLPPPPDISRTRCHMKFILKRDEIRQKLWTKNQYYAYIYFFTLFIDDFRHFFCLIKITILAKKKPVLKTILIKFNATFYVKDYCKVSGHNMLYFRKYSHFLSEIMILYLYKKTSITKNQVYLNTIKAHPSPSQTMGTWDLWKS